ncbi:MAG: hypothetical protein N2B02_05850, partial [Amylibacter sp.]
MLDNTGFPNAISAVSITPNERKLVQDAKTASQSPAPTCNIPSNVEFSEILEFYVSKQLLANGKPAIIRRNL